MRFGAASLVLAMLLAMDSCACLMGTRTFSPAVISYPASPFQRRIPALCMPSIVAVASRHSAIIMSTGSPGPQPTPLPLSSGRVNACIGALLLLFAANQWSRSLIFYLVDFSATERSPAELAEAARLFVNVDLSFDAAQYGLLASIGFASLFSLVSLIAGGVVDRLDARAVLAISGMLWSASYAWQASAASFGELAAARLLSGVGQAFGNPASYTALGKLVPPERRATANGIYSSGIYIGGGLAALSVIIDQQLGWRGLSALAAVAGVATSALVFTTLPPLPPSAAFETPVDEESSEAERSEPLLSSRVSPASSVSSKEVPEEAPPAAEALSELLDTAGIKWLLLGSTLRFMAGFSVGVWIVPFFRGEFPTQIGAEFALLKASVNGVAGAASAIGGGVLTDRLARTDSRFEQWVPAAGSLLAIPFWLATIHAGTLELSLAALFVEYLLAECWFGPTVAALQKSAPAGAQGLTQGAFNVLTLAGNVAPALLGLLLRETSVDLPTALSYSVPLLYAGAAIAFIVAGEQFKAAKDGKGAE